VCGYPFTDIKYEQLHQRALALNSSSRFATVYSAQKMFKIAPSELRGQKCSPDIIHIFDRNRTANFNASAVPAVLFSGAIHGDERVVRTAHKIVVFYAIFIGLKGLLCHVFCSL
jgi:hypothetical protein